MKSFFREVLITVLLSISIFVLLKATVQSISVLGTSMRPNFEDGQRLLINRVVYRFHPPQRGDVIVFYQEAQHEAFIKRVIGLPGDTVEIKNGLVWVNGKSLDESAYIEDPPNYPLPPYRVPPGQYFVLGDNRNNSNDSHRGWVVPRQDIIGKAWLIIWPPDRWGGVPVYSLNEQLLNRDISTVGSEGSWVIAQYPYLACNSGER